MSLILTGKNLAGKIVTFPLPFRLNYNADRDIPCDDLDVVIPQSGDGEEFCEVALSVGGIPFFEGIVDRQTSERAEGGNTLRLECRSKTALLLDNEVKPYIYFQLTSGQIFERFAAPGGVLGAKFPFEGKKNYLTVKKGSSNWKIIEDFCLLVYRKQPYINRQRVLVLEPLNSRVHILSNRQKGGVPYLRAAIRQKNDKVISKLYMKTATETYGSYYGVVFDNPEAARRHIRRERYYHPDNVVTENAKDETRRIIEKSNLASFEVEVDLPLLLDAEVGDRVRLPDEKITQNLFIGGLSYNISESGGSVTRLILRPE